MSLTRWKQEPCSKSFFNWYNLLKEVGIHYSDLFYFEYVKWGYRVLHLLEESQLKVFQLFVYKDVPKIFFFLD